MNHLTILSIILGLMSKVGCECISENILKCEKPDSIILPSNLSDDTTKQYCRPLDDYLHCLGKFGCPLLVNAVLRTNIITSISSIEECSPIHHCKDDYWESLNNGHISSHSICTAMNTFLECMYLMEYPYPSVKSFFINEEKPEIYKKAMEMLCCRTDECNFEKVSEKVVKKEKVKHCSDMYHRMICMMDKHCGYTALWHVFIDDLHNKQKYYECCDRHECEYDLRRARILAWDSRMNIKIDIIQRRKHYCRSLVEYKSCMEGQDCGTMDEREIAYEAAQKMVKDKNCGASSIIPQSVCTVLLAITVFIYQ